MSKLVIVAICLLGCGKVLPLEPDGGGLDADPCETNTCECTVATQAIDCPGAHHICDETSGPGRVCACAPAYKDDGTGTCVFDAAPFDGAFADPGKWTAVGPGSMVVDPTVVGGVDDGAALFDAVAACQFGSLTQSFVMPPIELADQFKLTVTHTGVDPSFFEIPDGTFVSVGVNGEFNDSLVTRNAAKTESFCLGPRAYGRGPVGSPVTFQVAISPGPFADNFLCGASAMASFSIDRVALEVAGPGECPNPGTVVNGDFELDTDWTFSAIQSATGTFVNNAGENGTRAARLATANRCSEITMTGTAAFPEDLQHPAVDVFFSGTSGARLVFQLEGKNVATIDGVNTPAHKRICLPKWARGTTSTIGFFLQRSSDNGCTTALARTFTLDNVAIVDDPACVATGEITDPGFENTGNGGPVLGWGLVNEFVNDLLGAQAFTSTLGPHAGQRALRLIGSNECATLGSAGGDFTINVPPAEGAAGPAVKFFANVGNGNLKTQTRIAIEPGPRFMSPGLRLDIPEVGVYQPQVFCLPPTTIGRRLTFRFSNGDPDGGGCTTNYPDEIAVIDDVEVGTDPSCPAQ